MTASAEYRLWIESPFRPYAVEYIEGAMELLAAVTEDAVCLPYHAWGYEDPDWLMDCQDYYDAELLLDFTGNLDAPL